MSGLSGSFGLSKQLWHLLTNWTLLILCWKWSRNSDLVENTQTGSALTEGGSADERQRSAKLTFILVTRELILCSSCKWNESFLLFLIRLLFWRPSVVSLSSSLAAPYSTSFAQTLRIVRFFQPLFAWKTSSLDGVSVRRSSPQGHKSRSKAVCFKNVLLFFFIPHHSGFSLNNEFSSFCLWESAVVL